MLSSQVFTSASSLLTTCIFHLLVLSFRIFFPSSTIPLFPLSSRQLPTAPEPLILHIPVKHNLRLSHRSSCKVVASYSDPTTVSRSINSHSDTHSHRNQSSPFQVKWPNQTKKVWLAPRDPFHPSVVLTISISHSHGRPRRIRI
jgi:hypothetical protein